MYDLHAVQGLKVLLPELIEGKYSDQLIRETKTDRILNAMEYEAL